MARQKEFFHGSIHDIQGEYLLPQKRLTGEPAFEKYEHLYSKEPWRREHVFSTGSEKEAWSWAIQSGGRPRVYNVKPEGKPAPEAYSGWDVEDETISRRARVLGTQFTPPPDVAKHLHTENWKYDWQSNSVQGTLPGLNWEPSTPRAKKELGDRRNQILFDRQAEDRLARAAESVRKQDALNNRGRQRSLFK